MLASVLLYLSSSSEDEIKCIQPCCKNKKSDWEFPGDIPQLKIEYGLEDAGRSGQTFPRLHEKDKVVCIIFKHNIKNANGSNGHLSFVTQKKRNKC